MAQSAFLPFFSLLMIKFVIGNEEHQQIYRSVAVRHVYCAMDKITPTQVKAFEKCYAKGSVEKNITTTCERRVTPEELMRREVDCSRVPGDQKIYKRIKSCIAHELIARNFSKKAQDSSLLSDKWLEIVKCQENILETLGLHDKKEVEQFWADYKKFVELFSLTKSSLCSNSMQSVETISKSKLCTFYSGLFDEKISNKCSQDIWRIVQVDMDKENKGIEKMSPVDMLREQVCRSKAIRRVATSFKICAIEKSGGKTPEGVEIKKTRAVWKETSYNITHPYDRLRHIMDGRVRWAKCVERLLTTKNVTEIKISG